MTIGLRDELQWFAQEMEAKLRLNDHKSGALDMTYARLLTRLRQEIVELTTAIEAMKGVNSDYRRVVLEASDVANFSAFIAQKAHRDRDVDE